MNSKKQKQIIPADKLAMYDKLISMNSSIVRKGATLPYTSVNGNMFTFLSNDGKLNIRLPEIDRENFINKFKTRLSFQNGVIMKEYVVVPESLLNKTSELQIFVERSFEFAKSLKSKATRKN